MIISFGFFTSNNFFFIISLNLLLILFLSTDFLENFLLTIKPKRLKLKSFSLILKYKHPCLNPRPRLNTASKSFFFVSRFFWFNILGAKFFSSLFSPSRQNPAARFCFQARPKAMGSSPFFLFGLICYRHICNYISIFFTAC